MVNVIVGIPTGYVVSRDTREWMYASKITGLQRILFINQKLITFFSHVRSFVNFQKLKLKIKIKKLCKALYEKPMKGTRVAIAKCILCSFLHFYCKD